MIDIKTKGIPRQAVSKSVNERKMSSHMILSRLIGPDVEEKMSQQKQTKTNHRRRDTKLRFSNFSIASILVLVILETALAKENDLVYQVNKSSTAYPVYEKVSPLYNLIENNKFTEKYDRTWIPVTEQPVEVTVSTFADHNTTAKSETFGRKFTDKKYNTGNALWDGILNQCLVNPKLTCIQKNVYTYLYDSLGFGGDVNVTSSVLFKKNRVDYRKYTAEANTKRLTDFEETETEESGNARTFDEKDNEIDADWEAETPIEEVTGAVYDRSVNFLMTHDLEMQLPEMMFDGATLKISPRALTAKGALVHLELEPKKNDVGEGRIFFKKIKKFFRNKLLTAFLAIVILIKLIKLKLFFLLPLIVGVTTAKKLFLKFLLFLFPALTQIFKLCSWYHQNYHSTKFHHHHHLISHIQPHHHHHAVPAQIIHHGGHHVAPPPPAPYFPHSNAHAHQGQNWELSGPGLGPEYIAADIHRNAIATFKPNIEDINEIKDWGLGPPGPDSAPGSSQGATATATVASGSGPSATDNRYVRAPPGPGISSARYPGVQGPPGPGGSSPGMVSLQAEKEALLRAAAMRIKQAEALKAQDALRGKPDNLVNSPHDPASGQAERFFSSVVGRVERILAGMGALDPGCRERAVCQIYREPALHAPHSNLVSNELSRDANELPQVAGSKSGVRFYRYVQSARDGQDKKDCLFIHQHCPIDFDKKKRH